MENPQPLVEKLQGLAPEGKISCTDARKLAAELDLEPAEIGQWCDQLKIKIMACELGCF